MNLFHFSTWISPRSSLVKRSYRYISPTLQYTDPNSNSKKRHNFDLFINPFSGNVYLERNLQNCKYNNIMNKVSLFLGKNLDRFSIAQKYIILLS